MPKLSIIIPVYNAEKFVKDCIRSAQNQSEKDIEIVVVNDGSTDSTQTIIEEIRSRDSRVRIVNKRNQGVSIARNVGISMSTSEFIVFADADDTIDPLLAETLLSYTQNNDIDVLIYSYYNINTFKHETYTRKTDVNVNDYTKADFCLEMNSHQLLYPVWNKLYRKEIVNNIKFEEIVPGEDLLFNLDVFSKSIHFGYLDKPLYNYYSRGTDSLLNSFKKDLKKNELLLINHWESFLDKEQLSIFSRTKFLNQLKFGNAYELLKNLYRQNSPYDFRSRSHIIRKDILDDSVIMNYIHQGNPRNRLEQFFSLICKSNCAFVINLLYTIITKTYKVLRSHV